MKISILTLFPEMFIGPFDQSIIKNAKEKKLIQIQLINIRDFGLGKHKIVDDAPYGGGIGMVMRVDVLYAALQKVLDKNLAKDKQKTVLLSAHGQQFKQTVAKKLSKLEHLILLCGHYEGVDYRITKFIDGEISIGDFITTGGEIPAMLVADAVTRLIPGVLKTGVTENESFSITSKENKQLLEFPQYTRPDIFKDLEVPHVLVSGNHKAINEWRSENALKVTQEKRLDLLKDSIT